MPIRQFLHPGHQFDPEAVRVLGLAFEMACGALRLKNRDADNDAAWVLANKLIELAKEGERNPNQLCEYALAWATKSSFGPSVGAILAGPRPKQHPDAGSHQPPD